MMKFIQSMFPAFFCTVSAVFLGACADSPSTPAVATNAAITAGTNGSSSTTLGLPAGAAAPLGAISPDALTQAMSGRRDVLTGVYPKEMAAGIAAVPQLKGNNIELQFDTTALFETASAQLKPQALAMISRLAKWQRADGRVVLHVEGREALQSVDDLAARRAATVADFLITEGAPPSRVRAQAQPIALVATPGMPSAVIAVIVVPVIAGSEALAWMPPVPAPAAP